MTSRRGSDRPCTIISAIGTAACLRHRATVTDACRRPSPVMFQRCVDRCVQRSTCIAGSPAVNSRCGETPADFVRVPSIPTQLRRVRPRANRLAPRLRASAALHATARPCRRLRRLSPRSSRRSVPVTCSQQTARSRRSRQRTQRHPAARSGCDLHHLRRKLDVAVMLDKTADTLTAPRCASSSICARICAAWRGLTEMVQT